MEFLSAEEILEKRDEIKESFDDLLKIKALVGKTGAAQWKFFQACFKALVFSGKTTAPIFKNMAPTQAAQLKFEVEDRLRRFYLRPGKPHRFIFAIVHVSHLNRFVLDDIKSYPSFFNYCILIREHSEIASTGAVSTTLEMKAFLERVVTESIDAEFRAYAALPEIRVEELKKWFYPDSPAIKEITDILSRHKDRKWIISNPVNPSTKRLLRIKIQRLDLKECFVHTTEYWYLRWWDVKKNAYSYPYRETNTQVYILRKNEGTWKVYQNLRPSPRTSTPHRRVRTVV